MSQAEGTRRSFTSFEVGATPYRALRALDWGGPGEWFEGQALPTGRRVGLHVLPLHGVSEERFAKCAADSRVESEGALGVVDLVRKDDSVIYVTEWFDAEPVSARRARHGRLATEWVERMVRAVARTLASAHDRNLIHGCLTSDQVLCAADDAPDPVRFKTAGFGLRWLIRADAGEATVVDDIRALAQIAAECLSASVAPDSDSARVAESAARRMVNEAYAAASPRSLPILEEAWSGFRLPVATRVPRVADPISMGSDWHTDSYGPAKPRKGEEGSRDAGAVEAAVAARRVDEDVQISVYRPKVIAPSRWYRLLAYTHLAAKRPEDPESLPDPVQEVQRRARAALGDAAKDYRSTTQETLQGLPEGGQITFVPEVSGIEFNPRSRSFAWLESIHEEAFSLRAEGVRDGSVLRGTLTAYLGPLLLAEVPLSFKVDRNVGDADKEQELSRARAYRKVFASYSRRDAAVVRHFDDVMATLGERYLIDVRDVRAGELWSPRLEELIRQADVFQLFWSSDSMRSQFCRAEWEYALGLNRERFVRPVFWESPMPRDDGNGLPPPELDRIGFATFGASAAPAEEVWDPASRLEGLVKQERFRAKVELQARLARQAAKPELAHEAAAPHAGTGYGVPSPSARARPASTSEPPRAKRGRWLASAASLAAFTLLIGASAFLTMGKAGDGAQGPGPVAVGRPTPTDSPVATAQPTSTEPVAVAQPTPTERPNGVPRPTSTPTHVVSASPPVKPPIQIAKLTILRQKLAAAEAEESAIEARLTSAPTTAERARIQADLNEARARTAAARRQIKVLQAPIAIPD
jgi:hypothetical protein